MTNIEKFGNLRNGTPVHRITLQGGGLTANVLTYGAVLQDLRLDGHAPPLVLGFDRFAPYLTHSRYFGALAGRCANRVRDGHLELDGRTYQLDRNFLGKHMLHGGAESMGKLNWQIVDATPDSATLGLTLHDGHMGFPGELTAQLQMTLCEGGVLDMNMTARTDAPTLCNLAHHSYFMLDGGGSLASHDLQIAADAYLPVDDELIPTGDIRAEPGGDFDFTQPRPVPVDRTLDHNFCLAARRGMIRPVARLSSRSSGVAMDIHTTEPGLQVYNGAKLDVDLPGLSGAPMGPFTGIALEPQIWPDANHHADFPQAILRPGETYIQHSQFVFSKEPA